MKTKLLNEMFKWGVLSAIIAVATPDMVLAQNSANELIHNVGSTQLPALPYILSAVCYVGGSFMMVGGALSLKKHAEAPAQEPMAKGIARLLTGGAITSVPALTGIIQNTAMVNGTTEATFTNFSASF